MSVRRPPRVLVWSWIGLLSLLGLTVTVAYQPLGAFNNPIALVIASLKVLIVAAVFMELRALRPLTIVFASAGLCWLMVLLWLASADFRRRPHFSPKLVETRLMVVANLEVRRI